MHVPYIIPNLLPLFVYFLLSFLLSTINFFRLFSMLEECLHGTSSFESLVADVSELMAI